MNQSQTLEKIADRWSDLTSDEKIALFKSKGNGSIARVNILRELSKFKILACTSGEGNHAAISLMAIPSEKCILPARLINIEKFKSILQAQVKGIFGGTGKCKVAVTTDLRKYKTYQDGAWQEIDMTNEIDIKKMGLTANQ